MKIGFITPEYPHPSLSHSGGLGTSIKNLVEALVKKNCSVSVFVYQQAKRDVFIKQGVTIHSIPKTSYPIATWFFYRNHIAKYVNAITKKEDIAILEAPDWTGITAFMRFKVPLVIRFHGSDTYFCHLEQRKQKFKNRIFETVATRGANAFIAPTTFAGELSRKLFGLQKKNIKTIHYGLKLEDFINEKPEQFNKNTILYIGTVIRKKGVLQLAEIFNKVNLKHPEAKLIIIGKDVADVKTGATSTYQLMDAIFSVEAKKNVSFLGKIPYAEVKQHIKMAHLCVFPSFAETLGMVTIESMALQKPVVNTSIGWAQELIDSGVNGYLVHPEDTHGFAKKILTLLNDEKLCLQIGKAAREKVETCFDIHKLANDNRAYYASLIK